MNNQMYNLTFSRGATVTGDQKHGCKLSLVKSLLRDKKNPQKWSWSDNSVANSHLLSYCEQQTTKSEQTTLSVTTNIWNELNAKKLCFVLSTFKVVVAL